MSKDLDIVVFGAYGYTGSLVSAYLFSKKDIKLGLAGRKHDKLKETLANLQKKLGMMMNFL